MLPNGGGDESPPLYLSADVGWEKALMASYPGAWKVGLRDEQGFEVAYAERRCVDDDPKCNAMAKQGVCSVNPKLMHRACAFSCGVCGSREEEVVVRRTPFHCDASGCVAPRTYDVSCLPRRLAAYYQAVSTRCMPSSITTPLFGLPRQRSAKLPSALMARR